MVKRKKRSVRKGSRKSKASIRSRMDVAQKYFVFFLLFFLVFFIAYNFSTNLLFENFFGTLAVISGAITLVFLISLAILFVVRGGKRKKR